MKVRITFLQTEGHRRVSKEIELIAVPTPGSYFEYADGWGSEPVVSAFERGLHLQVGSDYVEISGYGPQFTSEEMDSLGELGWEISS